MIADSLELPLFSLPFPLSATGRYSNRIFNSRKVYMPTYTYQCPKCHIQYEKVQRITDPSDTVCTVSVGEGVCNGAVRRLIVPSTGAGFLLKGGGWYRDGY